MKFHDFNSISNFIFRIQDQDSFVSVQRFLFLDESAWSSHITIDVTLCDSFFTRAVKRNLRERALDF